MEELPRESDSPQPNKTAPLVVASILITALVAGGGVYAYQKNQATKTQEDLQAQIESLQSDLAAAQQVATTPTPQSTATPSPTPSTVVTPAATTDPTASWKIYTNTNQGYSIKYEPSWVVGKESGSTSGEPKRLSWIELQNTGKYGDAAVVVEVKENSYTSIDDWEKEMNNSDLGSGLYQVAATTLDGLVARQLSTGAEGGAVRTGVIKGNKLYVIHLIYAFNQKDKTGITQVYNQMLETFELTK